MGLSPLSSLFFPVLALFAFPVLLVFSLWFAHSLFRFVLVRSLLMPPVSPGFCVYHALVFLSFCVYHALPWFAQAVSPVFPRAGMGARIKRALEC